jgi:hypothetical protein
MERQIPALMLSPFVGRKLGSFVASENREDLMVLKQPITMDHRRSPAGWRLSARGRGLTERR